MLPILKETSDPRRATGGDFLCLSTAGDRCHAAKSHLRPARFLVDKQFAAACRPIQ